MQRFACGALLLAVSTLLLLQFDVADAKAPGKYHRFKSARHHDNHHISLNTTHKRLRFHAGHISHFEHHRIHKDSASVHAHMFNIFRLMGDFSHIGAFAFLLFRLNAARSCAGISLKTQELYLAVFLCRYIDLFTNFISMYNTLMTVLFIGTTLYIVYMMRETLKESCSPEPEGSKLCMGLVPACAILALVLNDHTHLDTYFGCLQSFLWAFSIYLEAVAIVPQMTLLKRKKVVENITANYIVALGLYRAMYLVNWAYRWFVDPISSIEFLIKVAAGLVQTGLYVQFFRLYLQSKKGGAFGGDVVMDNKGLI